MLVLYHDDAEMQNGNNGGDSSGQIVPRIVQLDHVENSGTLEPQMTLQMIPMQSQIQDSPSSYLTFGGFLCMPLNIIGMLQQLRA